MAPGSCMDPHLSPSLGGKARRAHFTAAIGQSKSATDIEIEARLVKEIRFDPDLWIVEVEDRSGRSFLDNVIKFDLTFVASVAQARLAFAAPRCEVGFVEERGPLRSSFQ